MEIEIIEASQENAKEISNLFSTVISHTFKKEKFLNPIELQKEIVRQILNYRACLEDENKCFLVAKHNNEIVATVSFGKISNTIVSNTDLDDNTPEIKSVYVLPEHHGKGVGSKIYTEIIKRLKETKASTYCLDSGYASAQTFWEKKLGTPYKTLENFWGKDLHHKIWLINL